MNKDGYNFLRIYFKLLPVREDCYDKKIRWRETDWPKKYVLLSAKESGQLNSLIEKINDFGARHTPFFLFVDFEMERPLLLEPNFLSQESIFVSFPAFTNVPDPGQEKVDTRIQNVNLPDIAGYQKGFDIVMENLLYGNSFLTNYTCRTEIKTTSTLRQLFTSAVAKYKVLFKDKWVCFSPETFVQIRDGSIFSFPMKGTINAEIPDAEHIILCDEKEIAEHNTIVDLIRNDLSGVATHVCVETFRYIEKIKTHEGALLQVSSRIRGKLPADFHQHLGEILMSLLPAGSVSGAPKTMTRDIIRKAENYKRGYYTGVVFYFDGEDLDSCVLIRFIERINDKIYYKSGGGITVNSNMKKEYQEVLDKIYVPIH